MKRTFSLVLVAALVALALPSAAPGFESTAWAAGPDAADKSVTIEADVGISAYSGRPPHVSLKSHSFAVPAGANGTVILDRAVEEGFIDSYETVQYGSRRYVRCIDNICMVVGSGCCLRLNWWTVYKNGRVSSSYLGRGVKAIAAREGDRFAFSYGLQVNI